MTVPLWTAEDAARATGGTARGWTHATGIAIDNRQVEPGDLFIALKGENHDAHRFAPAALEAGAAAVMVHDLTGLPDGAPVLHVDDTFTALEKLGIAARARTDARVIAVTGSVGKTSTKEMLRTMLAGQGRTHAAVRSFNNHWGVPLTLARMPADTEFAVIEIGMNHGGEITPLSRFARPHVALITTVEAVHLEAFDSVAEIADAKAEIFAGLEPAGTAILPADNPHIARLTAAASPHTVLTFGTEADATLREARSDGHRTAMRVSRAGTDHTLTLATPGEHFAMNAAGALLAAEAAGADWTRAAHDLQTWVPPEGRGSQTPIQTDTGDILLLNESYNANPASVRAALAVLSVTPAQGRRHALLGDMLELGPTEQALHAGLATLPELDAIDRIHTCGPRMAALHDALPPARRGLHCADSVQLAARVASILDAGDVCMVKGSLGARMAVVVDAIKALGMQDDAEGGAERKDD